MDHLRLPLQEFADGKSILAVLVHSQGKRFEAPLHMEIANLLSLPSNMLLVSNGDDLEVPVEGNRHAGPGCLPSDSVCQSPASSLTLFALTGNCVHGSKVPFAYPAQLSISGVTLSMRIWLPATTPATRSEWPLRYLVAECRTMSKPQSLTGLQCATQMSGN